jgi:hypothetical protein
LEITVITPDLGIIEPVSQPVRYSQDLLPHHATWKTATAKVPISNGWLVDKWAMPKLCQF